LTGRRVLVEEAEALQRMADNLGEAFNQAVEMILHCPNKVITCGVGKSGHVAHKASGTLSSTGTPSLFLHAAEAVHGDLGMVTGRDVVLMFTHSGETDELVRLFPSLRSIGAKTIVLTGRSESSAARMADIVLDTGVRSEACPHNLAPTTSTTAMLALADALAVEVMERRGFTKDDFARFHPSGALGRRLLLKVSDVMRKGADLPLVKPETPYLEVLATITRAGAGAACVVDEGAKLAGFISDGDLRRYLLQHPDGLDAKAEAIMARKVTTIEPSLLAIDAFEMFQTLPRKIGEMPVVDEEQRVVGLLMLKDLLRSGIL
jgi:arabinose-5-phosphate isomerase